MANVDEGGPGTAGHIGLNTDAAAVASEQVTEKNAVPAAAAVAAADIPRDVHQTANGTVKNEDTTTTFEPQVLVVDFHHARGPEVQFWASPEGQTLYNHNDWSLLPFLALADGAHAVTEEFSYFTLLNQFAGPEHTPPIDQIIPGITIEPTTPLPDAVANAQTLQNHERKSRVANSSYDESANTSSSRLATRNGTTLFGIACTRQIRSDLLKNKSPDVTRSTVQKAVVVILERPSSLGAVRERLGAVTAAWFGQQDFTNIELLKDLQEVLKRDAMLQLDEPEHLLGLSIREIIYEFRHQALVMVKALLLQRKILFFGSRCERLCLLQFALVSLIPNLTRNLQDCADPILDSYAKTVSRATSLRTSERSSLLAYMGLPLQIFGESSFFSPYTPLQLLDLLMDAATHSFVVGSTNSLLLAQKDRYCDVLVNLDEETNKIQIVNQDLRNALSLSAADRRWIDHLTQTVIETWDPANPSRPNTHAYAGSEDALRLQFEEYILSLLSSAAYKNYHDEQSLPDTNPTNHHIYYTSPLETCQDFNNEFLIHWRKTPNYALFDRLTRGAGIFDVIEPKHPTAGGLSIEDVQRRLAQGVAELHLDERVREGRETVGRVFGEGRERVGAGMARFWQGVDGFRQKREASRSRERKEGPTLQLGPESRAATKFDLEHGDIFTTATTPASATTPAFAKEGGESWGAPVKNRASLTQKPVIDTAQLSAAARDNATKAGQYLSSWGTWARDRGRDWSEGRRSSAGTDQHSRELKTTGKEEEEDIPK